MIVQFDIAFGSDGKCNVKMNAPMMQLLKKS